MYKYVRVTKSKLVRLLFSESAEVLQCKVVADGADGALVDAAANAREVVGVVLDRHADRLDELRAHFLRFRAPVAPAVREQKRKRFADVQFNLLAQTLKPTQVSSYPFSIGKNCTTCMY